MNERAQVTLEFLDEFADAWNRHDAEAILDKMTTDCVMQLSSGGSWADRVASGARRYERDTEDLRCLSGRATEQSAPFHCR